MMGTVFRKTYTKPIPALSEIFTRKGERFARWRDGKGKKRTAPLTAGRDGLDRIVLTVGTYTAKYRDGQGVIREVATGCRDEVAARSILAQLQRQSELVKSNVISVGEDAIAGHQATKLADHFAAYMMHQKAKELNATRIANTESRLNRIARDCGLVRLSDLTPTALERWLLERQQEDMSAGTRNAYREAWIGFGNWCVTTNRLQTNPMASLPKANVKADCRRKRRAMTEEELTRLLDATRRRPVLDAMTIRRGPNKGKAIAKISNESKRRLELLGRERSLIYKTYLLTGLRKSELASITAGQVHIGEPMSYLDLAAADEKNREGSQLPLRHDLAVELDEWIGEKRQSLSGDATIAISCQQSADLSADTPLFNIPTGILRILNRDLELANIPKVDERGRTIDIHALRHTFGTHLSKAGVAPRTAQAAMRHSSIDLTMNVYTDPKLLDVQGALERLPELALGVEQATHENVAKATGTDDTRSSLAPVLAPDPDNWCKPLSVVGNSDASSSDVQNEKKPKKPAVSQAFPMSGRLDLNQRPLRPERSALPS